MHFFLVILFTFNLCFAEDLDLKTPQGGPFELKTTEGKLTNNDLKGKDVFLFFGFTRCPDVCPLTMRRIKSLTNKLTKEEREQFRFIFISVDTERDNLETLKALKKTYGPSYIGATGTDLELTSLASSYGARFRRFKTKQGQLIVDHTDSIFYLDREGKWAGTIAHGASVNEMLEILRKSKMETTSKPHPERTAKLLTSVKDCNLSEKPCTAVIGKESFTLEFSPRPVTAEKKFIMKLVSDSTELSPREIDFEGISLNMGYLRPKLSQKSQGLYTGDYKLPVCELAKMDWRVRLIVVNKNGEWFYIDYLLSTYE